MTTVRRYGGFVMNPSFVPNGPTRPVMLAFDDALLTQWIGDPSTIWQTPLGEVHDLAVRVGRQLRIQGTVAGARYTWRTRRGPEHDDLVEHLRALGARVERDTRRRVVIAVTTAVAVLVASAASILAWVPSSKTSTGPSVASVAAVNVKAEDLPADFRPAPNALLVALTGTAGSVVYATTPAPTLTGTTKKIWAAVTRQFQSCLGVSDAEDRMFGSAGQFPAIQVSGTSFGASSFGGTEISSVTQHYATTTMVDKDLAEYSRPGFGRCWGQASAQLLLGTVTGTVAAATASYPVRNFTPVTFAHGFRRGGIATITVPSIPGTFTLVALYGAYGHDEINFYALTGDWARARPTALAAFEAMMARLSGGTGGGAA